MGYQAGVDDPNPPPKIELRSINRKDFELITPFAYRPADGSDVIEVPAHPNDCAASTDLASVPPLLWGLLPSYGRQLRAALLHDRLCDVVNSESDTTKAYRDRQRADDLFLEAMRDKGNGSREDLDKRVGLTRSWLFWAGVCYGRYWKFRKLQFLLLTIQVVLGVLALDFIMRLPILRWAQDWLQSWLQWDGIGDAGTLALIWLTALVLSVFWGRQWLVPVIGLLAGPLVLPVLLVTFFAQVLIGVADTVLRLFRREEPKPNFGPAAQAMSG